jgi:hypothetical protein
MLFVKLGSTVFHFGVMVYHLEMGNSTYFITGLVAISNSEDLVLRKCMLGQLDYTQALLQ